MITLSARLNGPFVTGVEIDVHALRVSKQNSPAESFKETYCRLQMEIFDLLTSQGSSGWKAPEKNNRKAVDYDTDDFAGSSIIPECFIECDLSFDATPGFHCPSFSRGSNEYKIISAKMILHDFGIGIVTLIVESAISPEPAIFRADIESINTEIANFMVDSIKPKLDEFWTAVTALKARSRGNINQYNDSDIAKSPLNLMWLHRIYVAVCDAETFKRHADLVPVLLVKHHSGAFYDSSIESGVAYYPSIGCSLAAFNEKAQNTSLSKLARMISLHNAYNAAIWMLDDLLFNQILDLRTEQIRMAERKVHLAEIEQHAHRIFRVSSNISGFLAIYKNRISRLSPQETILSEAICDAWRFEYQIQALEEKLIALKEMYQITMNLMSDSEARLLNKIVFLFTVINFVTFFTTIVDFIGKQEPPSLSEWRSLSILGVSFLLLLGGGWVFQRQFGMPAFWNPKKKREHPPI